MGSNRLTVLNVVEYIRHQQSEPCNRTTGVGMSPDVTMYRMKVRRNIQISSEFEFDITKLASVSQIREELL